MIGMGGALRSPMVSSATRGECVRGALYLGCMPVAALSESPLPKDVVVSVFAASAGVAGLVLVFLGILIATIGGYPGGTSDTALQPYRRAAWASVGVFGASLATVALSLAWLAATHAYWLYVLVLASFTALVLMLLVLAAVVTKATV